MTRARGLRLGEGRQDLTVAMPDHQGLRLRRVCRGEKSRLHGFGGAAERRRRERQHEYDGPVLASMFASGTDSARIRSRRCLPAAGSLAAGVCAADNAGNREREGDRAHDIAPARSHTRVLEAAGAIMSATGRGARPEDSRDGTTSRSNAWRSGGGSALTRASAAPEHYSVVATPLGNLRDLTLRALDVLGSADVIAAEDTRVTGVLLRHFGIAAHPISLHEHNEAARAEQIVRDLRAGRSVALVSDAGTPAISDPGARLVRAVRAAGFPVVPIPGPCAAIAAVSAAGLNADRLLFLGFSAGGSAGAARAPGARSRASLAPS